MRLQICLYLFDQRGYADLVGGGVGEGEGCVYMCLFVWHIAKEVTFRIIVLFYTDVFLVEGVATGSRVLLPTKTHWFILVMHCLITHVYLLSIEKNRAIQQTLLMRVF